MLVTMLTERVGGRDDPRVALVALERAHVGAQFGGVSTSGAGAVEELALLEELPPQQRGVQRVCVGGEELSPFLHFHRRAQHQSEITSTSTTHSTVFSQEGNAKRLETELGTQSC
jgi:hypothetical protein